ncbi:hypothetical protein CQW23_11490 [Capsicum baccatum]|uniref:FMN-dependent dehydrogenase domain-containing protein n=1 Tax=Capsicum baccatum TaxID=33114 RepID=A0A2G2WPY7_CAPBA|nr:hypothetical protein CQW23_11490 [Capsicum baccatum]
MAGEPVNVNEFEELARQVLPKIYYDFFAGEAEDHIQPRILVEVSRIDMSTIIFGHKTSASIMIAPTVTHNFAHPEDSRVGEQPTATLDVVFIPGEVATARGAASCDIIVANKREITEHIVRRAECNGFRAIILISDTPRLGMKEIAWVKSITKLPILINGILTREDATKAVDAGVAGIIVSNHGAQQLDYAPAVISVLEEVKFQLGEEQTYSRRYDWSANCPEGVTGLKQVIEMLENELEQTMTLAGCCTVDDITRNHVTTEKERFLCKM